MSSVFKRLNCLRLLITILRFDDRLIPVFSAISFGTKCVWGRCSYEQTNCSIKSMFSSVETVLGRPVPYLLSIEQVSLNFFNRRLKEEQSHFSEDGSSKFCKLTSFLSSQSFGINILS